MTRDDEYFMRLALEQAQAARDVGEVPIGAVVVDEAGEVVGRGFNRRETTQDPTAHAELLAMRDASQNLDSWRLVGCTTYVTLEPCPMCAGTMINSRLERVVYGARDPKAGAVRSLYALLDDPRFNHEVEVREGCLGQRCGEVLSEFFRDIRAGRIRKPQRSSEQE